MRYCSMLIRPLAFLTVVGISASAEAQIADQGSPYGAYALGELFFGGHAPEAMMGGVGLAYTEPVCVLANNPASYAHLEVPVLQGSGRLYFTSQQSTGAKSTWSDGGFTGFSLGVPFGKGKWGMALGLLPYSDVSYSFDQDASFEGGAVQYEYRGSGGLSRVFAGCSRVLWSQRPDSTGNAGHRLTLGANFDFLFGSVEQTRNAIYPSGSLYTDAKAYSSLVLRAPTADIGLLFEGQLIPRSSVAAAIKRRTDRHAARTRAWRDAHPGATPPHADRRAREAEAWRYTIGATIAPPAVVNAIDIDLVTSFIRGSSGLETTIDTIRYNGEVEGTLTLPASFGIGFCIHNSRWMVTAEARQRDWSALKVDIAGFDLPGRLRSSTTFSIGGRFTPTFDGNLFQRTTYRIGARYAEDYLELQGTPLNRVSIGLGASIPVNAAQTNSRLHLGVEFSQHGQTDNGLLREGTVTAWFGVSVTPWKRERWFRRYQIQ